ncbi:MAG: GTP-binding protein [Clostridiaceae bacterium]
MIIRKYIVNDMREAMIRAKYELGRDAIIIHQRKVHLGKWFNPFRKKMLEVTIAVEDPLQEKKRSEKESFHQIMFDREKVKDSIMPVENEAKMKKHKMFSRNKVAYARWEDYCEGHDISKDRVNYPQVKRFFEEKYPDNVFNNERKLGRINVLVGPTGVGKTTTIAKIASKELLENGKKVGLITIDTYRIAAVEQLKKYAEILGISCETVNEPSEMQAKLHRLRDCEIIFVDTVGASPKNEVRIEEIQTYIDAIEEEKNIYLTISMSSDVDTNISVMKTYQMLNYNAIVLTKFDEVLNYNNFWNLMENNALPVQYYCFGQTVPEDFSEATLDNVLSYFWRELTND